MKSASLVLFTVLSQTAVGAYCILAALQAFGGPGTTLNAFTLGTLLILVLGAMAASFFHLGMPRRAYRAILGWRSSWLSREIASVSAFAGLLALQILLALLRIRSPMAPSLILLTLCAGLLLVLSMSRAYMLRTAFAWNSLSTPLSFAATCCLAGIPLAWILLPRDQPDALLRFALLILLITAAVAQFAVGRRWTSRPSSPRSYGCILHPSPASQRAGVIHAGLLTLGLMLLLLNWTGGLTDTLHIPILFLSFISVLAGELVGRVQFYQHKSTDHPL